MPRWLKRGMDAGSIKAADAKVRDTVEAILAQVDERKDVAIRELSEKFDKWSPQDFRLTPTEVQHAIAQVPKRDLEDIKFAQAQVRRSSAIPCMTSKSRHCLGSCSATAISR
jgi:sulfopropanediol 3-dehydrogenase